jgi:putative toxin-antitoxin system antitoxin component (TIGR02293 family)
MVNENIVLTREELFDLVWTEPMTKLAQKYGISDVGLAKVCKRHQIPRPEQGHWVRVKNNWPLKPRPPLPPVHDPSLSRVVIEASQQPVSILERNLEADPLIIQERLPENKIQVTATLSSPHPLVRAATERAKKYASRDEIHDRGKAPRKRTTTAEAMEWDKKDRLGRDLRLLGISVFGDSEKFAEWMQTPIPALGNVRPCSLLGTADGIQELINELYRIEYGVFS